MPDPNTAVAPSAWDLAVRLGTRGLLVQGTTDRRLKHLTLTDASLDLLDRIAEPARRAHAHTIEALTDVGQQVFPHALVRLIDAGNAYCRAPLRSDASLCLVCRFTRPQGCFCWDRATRSRPKP
jgi:hypothetical protein